MNSGLPRGSVDESPHHGAAATPRGRRGVRVETDESQ